MSFDRYKHIRSMLEDKGVEIGELSKRLFADSDTLVEANNNALEEQLQVLKIRMLGNNVDLPK